MRLIVAAIAFAALLPAQEQLSGRRAPSFSLPDSKIVQYDILDYRGRWLILDFMKTNCPHCKALSKTLETLKVKYGAKLAILAVTLPPENTNTVGQYIAENHVTYPILFDSSQVAISYFKATPGHGAFDTPHWFAIDPNGMIVRDWGGDLADNPAWTKEFDLLVNKK